jgi:hypothetical protein
MISMTAIVSSMVNDMMVSRGDLSLKVVPIIMKK